MSNANNHSKNLESQEDVEDVSQLKLRIQSLRLKVSCLEASLKYETTRKAKNSSVSATQVDHLNHLADSLKQIVDKQKKQIEEQQTELIKLRTWRRQQLEELPPSDQIQICANMLQSLMRERTLVVPSSDEGHPNAVRWYDKEEYSSIVTHGKLLFREIIYQDAEFSRKLKEGYIRSTNRKHLDRNLVSSRGIRRMRREHFDRMRKGMAQYNPEYHTQTLNQLEYSSENKEEEQNDDDEPTIEQVQEDMNHNEEPTTTLREATEQQKPTTPDELETVAYCYTCRRKYLELHDFYDSLCPQCAAFNYEKRLYTCDLTGRIAIVTGGRIRIGYQTALKLLRNNCEKVVVVTRFPQNCLKRFSTEPDFETIRERLLIYGLDLRDLGAVEEFVQYMYNNFDRLDILINNAAQTIRRPPIYYASLIQEEMQDKSQLPEHLTKCLCEGKEYIMSEFIGQLKHSLGSIQASTTTTTTGNSSSGQMISTNMSDHDLQVLLQNRQTVPAALLSVIPRIKEDMESDPHDFPKGEKDDQLEQLDKRSNNTWKSSIESVSTVEALEVQMCNVMAPFILIQKLQPLMCQSPMKERFIVNVSSVEGLFSQVFKQKFAHHPHTNMSKSSLNMLTMTIAPKYASDYQIFVTCVDPGWVSQLCPFPQSVNNSISRNFEPPLDEIDAAARILDPIFEGVNHQKFYYATFLKDYEESPW